VTQATTPGPTPRCRQDLPKAVTGCLLGTAVGDALGLPCEGLTPGRQRRLFSGAGDGGYRLVFGRGMVSDETEHTLLVAQALLVLAGDTPAFERRLAHELRRWLLLLPAGAGRATLIASARLLVGVPLSRSGVFSAGNGPAMRSAILGVCFGNDPARLRALVRAGTRITHTDPKAEVGALAVALAAHRSAHGDASPGGYLDALRDLLDGSDGAAVGTLSALAEGAAESVARGESTETFAADGLGLARGVSGYVFDTVPVALHAWLRHPDDFGAAVRAVLRCGGDTDTTAAIVGGIVGAGVGKPGIPPEWLDGLCEWPRTVPWMERLGRRLGAVVETGQPGEALTLPRIGLAARNAVFLTVALAHGLRRLLPPY